jgi:hypothetical protein
LQPLVEYVSKGFQDLQKRAETAKCESDLDAVRKRATEISNLRAHVMQLPAIKSESQAILSEMSQWVLPDEIMKELRQVFDSQIDKSSDIPTARLAFSRLLCEYAFWDDYVDWHERLVRHNFCIVSTVTIISFVLSWVCLWYLKFHVAWLVAGFMLAGLCGTGVSILMKLPPVSVYGEANYLVLRTVARLFYGLVGTLVGLGILALGIVNIESFKSVPKYLSDTDTFTSEKVPACLAIGIIFGFSERALSYFSDRLLGSINGSGAKSSVDQSKRMQSSNK